MAAYEGEFLTFQLGEENYAVDIMKVREIRGYEPVTRIANSPPFIKGVLNLRGDIVPVIDLRLKFNVGEASYNEFTIVIMLTIQQRIVGVVVDAVSDVIRPTAAELKPPPEFGVAFDHQYLLGLVQQGAQMFILLNIDALITSRELGLFDNEEPEAML